MSTDVLPQHVSITMPDLRTMGQSAQIDPDVSATLTDFLAYTEHLPSAVIRSMTLIGEQDKIASDSQQRIHELLTTYSTLPTLKDRTNIPDAATLRRDVSQTYARLEKARRMAAAESARIAEMVNKDAIRLDVIARKLKTMPMPPSRDPTPEPVSSPQMKKSQPIAEKRAAHRVGSAPRVRGRKIMVPGEVLPPPNPDSPPPSEPSEVDSVPPSSPPAERKRQKSVGRARTPKPPKEPKEKKEKDKTVTPKPPRVRTPGQPGTNVHSSVAGISTSNALLALVPPPGDAVPGSKWLPWKRITEYELAKLRKRMKKNAIWLPSPAMRNRELKILGRGQQAMEVARRRAEQSGEPFIDEYGPAWSDPTRAIMSGEERQEIIDMIVPELDGGAEDELMNRGMRLNEAKKRKREKMLEEQAIQAQLSAEQNAADATAAAPIAANKEAGEDSKASLKPPATSKKRKRDTTPSNPNKASKTASPDTTHQPKKIKLTIPAPANAGTSSTTPRSPLNPKIEARSPKPRSRNISIAPIAPDATSNASPPEAKRPNPKITLKRSKAASAEPPNRRLALRRGSNVSLPGANRAGSVDSRPSKDEPRPEPTTGRTRRKRPAPGLITADEDGRAKSAVGKRKAAPKKRGRKSDPSSVATGTIKEEEAELQEEMDPDEPRYCLCGDVSYGIMVACEDNNCPIEWFHLECVELQEMPPRLAKWYCPECRKGDVEKGSETNGIVKRGK
ncbi:Chromatin modification-related protein YNG2-like protein 2 [Elsinoe fawcettii]|nr:Chromatin modification-related protein YNG2-like protein 2 [Elsinoe fawcettii]